MSYEICPTCAAQFERVLLGDQRTCPQCGANLGERLIGCPECGAPLTTGMDLCPHCGEPLTTLGRVIERQTSATAPRFLEVARMRSKAIKQTEELASQRRMETLREIDLARQQTEQERLRTRALVERRRMIVAASLSGTIFVLIALAAYIVTRLTP